MTAGEQGLRRQLWSLIVFRWRTVSRDPGTLVWSFVVPAVITSILAFAFRPTEQPPTEVGVLQGDGAELLSAKLSRVPNLNVRVVDEPSGRHLLARGKLKALVSADSEHRLIIDHTQEGSRAAKFQIEMGLANQEGATIGPRTTEQPVSEPGARYVDFLIPGIIGMQLMMTTSFMVGGHLAALRASQLLKRLAASPVSPMLYYVSLGVVRIGFGVVEAIYFTALGVLAFGLPIPEHPLSLLAFASISCLSWTMLFVVIGLRTKTLESYNGQSSLVTSGLIFASGVFFPSEKFPDAIQPLLHVLPLTALNQGLRALMFDDKSLLDLGPQLLVFLGWSALPLLLPRRAMRWV